MEEDDDKDDTKRKSRNLSEKKRRDQFNLLINELSSLVTTNNRKMDKSTVLKSTIAFLKNHNEVAVRSRVHEIQENWKPSFLPNEEFTHLILEALDGFIIVFSSSGRIHYASESITSLLGLLPNDLLHMTIYDMVYEEEQQNIYNILINPPKTVIDPLQSGVSPECQVAFTCHVKCESMETPPKTSFELVRFRGYFRDNIDVKKMMPSSRYSGCSDVDSSMLFVGTGRLITPQLIREISIVDTKSEFTSRHSLEWKFLYLDHRAPPIIGYLPFEVLGTSGYDYYHFEDLERVVTCHEALMQKGEGTSCFYRFLTKGQQWIWLQTRFYITYHQWNSKPEFVVCTHHVVSYADVMKHMRKSNGSLLREIDDNDSLTDDKKVQASLSNMESPWSLTKSSRASKSFTQSQDSSNTNSKRNQSYRPDSDSTSMSADSPLSHHSMLTQLSSRSRSRQRVPTPSKQSSGSHQQHQLSHAHYSQFSLPHSPASSVMSQHLIPINHTPHHAIAFQQPPVDTQILSSHQRPPGPSQVIGTSFIDQSQFLTALPVQPVYSATSTVISSLQPAPDYVHSNIVLSPAQNQFQDHLRRKHEELQKLIVQQQDELRRVSEQLFMTRCGIIPSIVALPFPAPMDQTDGSDSNRSMDNSCHMSQSSYGEMMPHTQISNQPQPSSQITIQSISPHQTGMHQAHPSHYPIPIHYDLNNPMKSEQITEVDQQNEDIMQYMQHQSQIIHQANPPASQHQFMHQQHVSNDEFELMPFQMLNQQAQILFSSGNANDSGNNNSSKQ